LIRVRRAWIFKQMANDWQTIGVHLGTSGEHVVNTKRPPVAWQSRGHELMQNKGITPVTDISFALQKHSSHEITCSS
jgi:hypothetical protein